VPNVNTYDELSQILEAVKAFDTPQEAQQAIKILAETTGRDDVGVGISRVLLAVETARQAEREVRPDRFAEMLSAMVASNYRGN
jgi:hypothetical protein